MFPPDALEGLTAEVRRVLDGLDADSMLGDEATAALAAVTVIERRAAAARLALARRVAETGAWRRRGHRSAADAVASATGCSTTRARTMLGTAAAAHEQPALGDALAAGELSEDQAAAIAPAARVEPAATSELVEVAKRSDVRATKAAADRVVDRATASEARRRRAWRNRGVHTTTDAATGDARLVAVGPAEAIAAMATAVDDLASDVQAGRVERCHPRTGSIRWSQRRFDALASLLGCAGVLAAPDGETPPATTTGRRPSHASNADDRTADDQPTDDGITDTGDAHGGAGSRPTGRPTVVVDLDLSRWATDEPATAEVDGLGPVPAAFAQQLLDDEHLATIVQLVIRDGTDPRRIVHYGRHVPPELKLALRIRDGRCTTPRCPGHGPTEIDHDPVDHAHGAPCAMHTLDNKCRGCHRDKTYHGHVHYGPPGDRVVTDADGTVLAADRPDHPPLDQLEAERDQAIARIRAEIDAYRSSPSPIRHTADGDGSRAA